MINTCNTPANFQPNYRQEFLVLAKCWFPSFPTRTYLVYMPIKQHINGRLLYEIN